MCNEGTTIPVPPSPACSHWGDRLSMQPGPRSTPARRDLAANHQAVPQHMVPGCEGGLGGFFLSRTVPCVSPCSPCPVSHRRPSLTSFLWKEKGDGEPLAASVTMHPWTWPWFEAPRAKLGCVAGGDAIGRVESRKPRVPLVDGCTAGMEAECRREQCVLSRGRVMRCSAANTSALAAPGVFLAHGWQPTANFS